MLLVAILTSIIPLIGKLLVDYKKWLAQKPVNHIKEFWIVIMCYVLPGILWIDWLDTNRWYAYPVVILMIGFLFWFLFDGLYNILRGFGWWFTGSDDKGDAKTDDLIQGLKPWQHKALKIGGMIIFTGLLIFIK